MQKIKKKSILWKRSTTRERQFLRVTTLYSQNNYSKQKVAEREIMRQQTEIKWDFMERIQASKKCHCRI